MMAEFTGIEARHLAPLGVSYDDLIAPFTLGDADQLRELLEGAGFGSVEVESRSVEARFPSPETFARRMETAYGSVIPAFARDPVAFAAYLDRVEADSRELVQRYSDGESVSFSMATLLALAHAA